MVDVSRLSELDAYLYEVSRCACLTKDEENKLIEMAQKGCIDARNRVIEANLKHVVKIVLKQGLSEEDVLDVISYANLMLIKVIDKYDVSMKKSFWSYACAWIDNAIKDACYTKLSLIHVPFVYGYKIECIHKKLDELERVYGILSDYDAARLLGMNIDDYQELMMYDTKYAYLNKQIVDTSMSVEEEVLKSVYSDELIDVINNSNLSYPQKYVIDRMYDFNSCEEVTLSSVSKDIGLSIERVRQVHNSALRKIKRNIR